MNLSELKKPAGQVKKQRRVGQGMGSGRGKYAGRGAKGQKSISGYSRMRGFEGGQMPLHRRMPKRGFTNPFREEYSIINLADLNELEGDSFDTAILKKMGVVKKAGKGLKVLGTGDITRKINVTVVAISKIAQQKIEAQGGTVTMIAVRPAGPATEAEIAARPPKAAKKADNRQAVVKAVKPVKAKKKVKK
jgi:large subunit ribosomal protein L15